MIFDVNKQYCLVNNLFKKPSKILYDDYITNDFSYGSVSDFLKNNNICEIKTSYKTYYFQHKEILTIKDFLTNENSYLKARDIELYDYLLIPKRKFMYRDSRFDFSKYLFNRTFDYSQNILEVSKNINLNFKDFKNFIIHFSPEVEKTLQESTKINTDSFHTNTRQEILQKFSSKIDKKYLKISNDMLELLSLFIKEDYELMGKTEVKLFCKSEKSFNKISNLLNNLCINYITKDFEIIVFSNFIEALFKDSFESLSILLELTEKCSKTLFNLLQDTSNFRCNSLLSASYLQEFFFRQDVLLNMSEESSEYYLSVVKDLKSDLLYFYPLIISNQQISNEGLIEIGI